MPPQESLITDCSERNASSCTRCTQPGLSADCAECTGGRLNPAFEGDVPDISSARLQVVPLKTEDDKRSSYLQVPSSLTPDKPPPSMDEPVESLMDFDDLLPYIGEFGTYQIILFFLMIPFAFFVAWVYFSQFFMGLTPEVHWCKVPELINANLTQEQRMALSIPKINGVYDKCSQYGVNFTEVLDANLTEADPKWPVIPCQEGWEYNFTDIPFETIATELNWVCEHAALPNIAQAIFFVGAIFGGLIFGWIADRYGRIPALIGTNVIGAFAGIATAFVHSFWTFSFCRFMVGFAFDNCFVMMYILVLEYVGPKWRTFVANMSIALFFTLAACVLPWLILYLEDWRMFTIVTSAPLLLAVFTPLVVPESARWLLSQGQVDRAIVTLKKFEKVNKTHVDDKLYKKFRDDCIKQHQAASDGKTYSVIDLFVSPRLRKITILFIIIWYALLVQSITTPLWMILQYHHDSTVLCGLVAFTFMDAPHPPLWMILQYHHDSTVLCGMSVSLVFDGHVRNVGALGLDVFMTFTIACATEMPADTFLTLVLDRWGRRWLACGSMVFSGVFSLLATVVPSGLPSASLAILGRFSVNISYNIGLQYAAEVLPTVVRAQGVALIHIMGYVASILAPFVVYLANVSPVLPLIILGIIGIFGGVLCLFLPETLDQELPQTLEDGENFGLNQRFMDMPCVRRKPDETPVKRFTRSRVSSSIRASIRGETYRSSMILRDSIRSRRPQTESV